MTNFLTARLCASLLALGFFVLQAFAAEVLPVLQTKTETYANVTVISRTATHVFVQHSRGVANIKLAALDAQALNILGIRSTDAAVILANSNNSADPAGATTANSTNRFAGFAASLSESLRNLKSRLAPGVQVPDINQTVALGILGGLALAYLCFCYCSMLICKKTGNEPGLLIWLPVLQIFPLLKAAGMPGWWFVLWCVPGLNIVAKLIWCVKISQARGKGTFTAIMLILPVTNFFAYLYLAFSDGRGATDEEPKPPLKTLQTEPLPA